MNALLYVHSHAEEMMLPKILIGLSAAVLFLLGVLHLVYTFRGPKLLPRDPALLSAMQTVSPVISAETTMWKAWVGFNASHSMGAILFGLVYGYLGAMQAELLFGSAYLQLVGFAMLAGFFLLGRSYWFSIPYRCITFSLACYSAAVITSGFIPG